MTPLNSKLQTTENVEKNMPGPDQYKTILKDSFYKAMRTSYTVAKIILPFYVLVDILKYLDLLRYIAFIFNPLAMLLDLPKEAALALAGGGFFNLYTGIALAAPLEMSAKQWTVIAVFLGFFHSILIESAVLHKLGIPRTFSISFRLLIGLISGAIVNIIPSSYFNGVVIKSSHALEVTKDFWSMLALSVESASILTLKIVLLIALLVIAFDLLRGSKKFGTKLEQGGTLFKLLAGVMLGVTYGAGLLISDDAKGSFKSETAVNGGKNDLVVLGLFLMLCHGIIEETMLFTLFGASLWPIVLARLSAASLTAVVMSYFLKRSRNMRVIFRVKGEQI
jgi:hypothetical protein